MKIIDQLAPDGREWDLFDTSDEFFRSNHCTLNGLPARVVGMPNSTRFATIEPVDVDADPIRCCWDVVRMVLEDSRDFRDSDDDTDL